MSIGPEIKEVYQEVGLSYHLYTQDERKTEEPEYLVAKTNAQVTKPFVREFFLEAQVAYDSLIRPGMYLQVIVPNDYYMVMNATPVLFEDQVIRYDIVLYKTNVLITIYEQEQAVDPNNYKKESIWNPLYTDVRALASEPLFGNLLLLEDDIGTLELKRDQLYIPAAYSLKSDDRIELSTGERFWVTTVLPRRYPAVDLANLQKDTR